MVIKLSSTRSYSYFEKNHGDKQDVNKAYGHKTIKHEIVLIL